VFESLRCPLCKGEDLETNADFVKCTSCGRTFRSTRNFIDFLERTTERLRYDGLGKKYAELYGKIERGELGPSELCYGQTEHEEFEEFLSQMRLDGSSLKGLRILDAGCGTGRLAAELADKGATSVALDIHDKMEEYSRQMQNRLRSPFFVRASVENTPFRDESFDIVWCQGVLSYVDDPISAIRELKRVTSRSGLMYLWMYMLCRSDGRGECTSLLGC